MLNPLMQSPDNVFKILTSLVCLFLLPLTVEAEPVETRADNNFSNKKAALLHVLSG